MKRLILLISLLLPSLASAQTITVLPWDFWRGVWVDGYAMTAHDTRSAEVPWDEFVLWKTPGTMRVGEVDSIGLWCEIPDGAKVKLGTGWDHGNFFFNDTLTSLAGPKEYGLYFVPFVIGSIPTVEYVVAYIDKGSALIDACCIKRRHALDVKESVLLIDKSHAHWYNELGVQDSIHGVIYH